MRLICPNCGAQYDVPTEVIPEAGRDVQCSNCGHTWYQTHPDQDEALADELDQPLPDAEWSPEDDDDAPTIFDSEPADETPGPVTATEDDVEDDTHLPETYLPDDTIPDEVAHASEQDPSVAPVKPRGLDPEVADIFREEREYEARLRQTAPLESQPDLGLTDPDDDELERRSQHSRERISRLRGDAVDGPGRAAPKRPARPAIPTEAHPPADPYADEDTERHTMSENAAAAAAAAGSRRDLLPDVDEINQTLRANPEPRVIDTADRPSVKSEDRPQGGFGKGFALIIVLGLIALSTYAMAPKLSEALPQAAPALNAYTAKIDEGRDWLDDQVKALMQMLDGMSSEATDPNEAAPETPVTLDKAQDD
ncbi:zinc-ribbon domain-containing protein [Sagittula sp. NFXS13]|uniref:zinc-ribbon domain-containing protein n=1 Tax=Sagittula sp. NFXS13 TaxID=2819095 RepID=UPI0032DF423E